MTAVLETDNVGRKAQGRAILHRYIRELLASAVSVTCLDGMQVSMLSSRVRALLGCSCCFTLSLVVLFLAVSRRLP